VETAEQRTAGIRRRRNCRQNNNAAVRARSTPAGQLEDGLETIILAECSCPRHGRCHPPQRRYSPHRFAVRRHAPRHRRTRRGRQDATKRHRRVPVGASGSLAVLIAAATATRGHQVSTRLGDVRGPRPSLLSALRICSASWQFIICICIAVHSAV